VPIPIRWRHVHAGDVVLGLDGSLWAISGRDGGGTWTARRGPQVYTSTPDLDDVISVLIPVPERDAVELTRETLGARLVERRTAPPSSEE
jgi:hypothetical protein